MREKWEKGKERDREREREKKKIYTKVDFLYFRTTERRKREKIEKILLDARNRNKLTEKRLSQS